MSKTSSDPVRHALNGSTMGTRWQAAFHAAPGFDPQQIEAEFGDRVMVVAQQRHVERRFRPSQPFRQLARGVGRRPRGDVAGGNLAAVGVAG